MNRRERWILIDAFACGEPVPTPDQGRGRLSLENALQCRTPLPGSLYDPVPVKRKRRDAGQAAAARGVVGSGRPADDADNDRAALPILKYRTAGIPGTRAEPVAGALPNRIDQTNLQAPGPAGGDEAGNANGPSGVALAADGHADASDREVAAGDNRDLRRAERGYVFFLERSFELQQCHVGGGAMRRHRLHVERGMNRHIFHVLQLRLPVGAVFDDLVGRPRLHAMRRRQYQPLCDQCTGAEIAARADNGDNGAADAFGGRRPAADNRVSRRGKQQSQTGHDPKQGFHATAITREYGHRQAAIEAGPRAWTVLAVSTS